MSLPLLAHLLDSPDQARARARFHLREAEEALFRVTELEGPGPRSVGDWLRVRKVREKVEAAHE